MTQDVFLQQGQDQRIRFEGGRAVLHFSEFGPEAYQLFLAAKKLPEKEVTYDWRADTYSLKTSARFADRLGGVPPPALGEQSLASHLWDYQAYFTGQALKAKRFAQYWDCGLGKTVGYLEFGRQVVEGTAERFLHFVPVNVIPQVLKETDRFYGDSLRIRRLGTRGELEAFLAGDGEIKTGIVNYEKLDDGPLPELKALAGINCDESSMLKTGGGKRKWNLIHSCKGIEYKLSNTATPAPNEAMEYASQAAFLETMRHEGDVLWTYFSRRDGGEWEVKPHARQAFYGFLSSWSAYLRSPATYGFKDNVAPLLEPEWIEHILQPTPEQMGFALDMASKHGAGLFGDQGLGIVPRTRLSQAEKGFLYDRSGSFSLMPSLKPAFIGDLVRMELAQGRQVIVWTVFDAEADLLAPFLPAGQFEVLDGRTKSGEERERILERTESGVTPVLVTKAASLGFGRHLVQFSSAIISGFDDSSERLYQLMRRIHRYGAPRRCRFHLPYIPELSGLIWSNVAQKMRRMDEEADIMERCYCEAMGLGRAA